MRTFDLYPRALSWWSMADYGVVLDVVAGRGATCVLEFGPGSSTLALIEGGATSIDTCEDSPEWCAVYRERLARRFSGVTVHPYTWADPLAIPSLDGRRYDLALIDGPHGIARRPACITYALARATAVLVPTEDAEPGLRPILTALAAQHGRGLSFIESGPLSGGFALLTLEGA